MSNKPFNQPLSGNEMPRCGGIATMMRLPMQVNGEGLDVAFVGIPFDIGTSNRPGSRLGPRQIRDESRMLRPYNVNTFAAPFESLQVADIGDVPINTFNLLKSIDIIESFYQENILRYDCKPITLGGDHTIVLPILRAITKKYGPVAVVHIDAHADVNDEMFGEKIAHGTPFRRAVEEGLLLNDKVFQIGLRGTGYSADEFKWSIDQGFTVIPADQCWYQSLAPVMAKIRAKIGDSPLYLSFDIDGIDPAYAPGTGTVEIAGLTVPQSLEIIRGLKGCQLVGADLVEVSPPYDSFGSTAVLAANLAFEMLCVFPGVKYDEL